MSREQRRREVRTGTQGKSSRGGPPSRRTPVKAPSGGFPILPVLLFGGVVLVIGLLGYLIFQSGGDDGPKPGELTDSEKAEQDDSTDIPGVFVQAQGRGHHNYPFSEARPPTPFCEGVVQSESAAATPADATSPTATTTATSTPTSTPTVATAVASAVAGTDTPVPTQTPQQGCYASNPPTSGRHLGVERGVDVGGGAVINIPPDPDVYPDDVVIPRDAIPHLMEHAGVFLGWNCAEGDSACTSVVDNMKDLANKRINNNDNRVILSRDPDLPVGEVTVASWTRYIRVPFAEYDRNTFEDFISENACRFDPEGFCG